MSFLSTLSYQNNIYLALRNFLLHLTLKQLRLLEFQTRMNKYKSKLPQKGKEEQEEEQRGVKFPNFHI